MLSRSHHSFVYPLSLDENWTAPQSEPRRKALLIGINYKSCGKDDMLVGPHSDVSQMKHLLQNYPHPDTYAYPSQNIVTMLDDGIDAALQPTRDNIIREIKKLISDALPGDRFFFLYSGHSEQVENIDNTEEDGKDECLVPVDAKGKDDDNEVLMIRDDELKEHLVDSLPGGARLTAVFDSCHSGTLLDLAHIRCNRVFIPWTHSGRCHSLSIWNANVRDDALEVGPTRHVSQTRRISSKVVKNSNRPLERAPVRRQRLEVRTLHTRPTFSSLSSLSTNDLRSTNDGNSIGSESLSDFLGLDMEFCDSPVKMWCDGWCDPSKLKDDNGADVIALASCKDDQISWEDGNGNSMTKALINILQKKPHPQLIDLMNGISHEFHKFGINYHQSIKQYNEDLKKYRECGGKQQQKSICEMDCFQEPQLSSLEPLDLYSTQWEP